MSVGRAEKPALFELDGESTRPAVARSPRPVSPERVCGRCGGTFSSFTAMIAHAYAERVPVENRTADAKRWRMVRA